MIYKYGKWTIHKSIHRSSRFLIQNLLFYKNSYRDNKESGTMRPQIQKILVIKIHILLLTALSDVPEIKVQKSCKLYKNLLEIIKKVVVCWCIIQQSNTIHKKLTRIYILGLVMFWTKNCRKPA